MLPYIIPFALFIGLGIIGSQFENGTYVIILQVKSLFFWQES